MTASEKKKAYYQANKEKWKKYRADGRAKFPERDNEVAKRYYWRHRDKILGTKNEYIKEYCLKNKERLTQYRREYYIKNKEAHAAYGARYRLLHPENGKRKAYRALYRLKNKDKIRERQRLYRIEHKEELKIKKAEWRKKNPDKDLAQVHRRRVALERRHPSADTFIAFVMSRKMIPCYWCGKLVPGKEAHIDHVIALSRGGNHCSSNLCASCGSCNYHKHSKLPTEWIKSGQLAFDV